MAVTRNMLKIHVGTGCCQLLPVCARSIDDDVCSFFDVGIVHYVKFSVVDAHLPFRFQDNIKVV